jgi:hypothetical protein
VRVVPHHRSQLVRHHNRTGRLISVAGLPRARCPFGSSRIVIARGDRENTDRFFANERALELERPRSPFAFSAALFYGYAQFRCRFQVRMSNIEVNESSQSAASPRHVYPVMQLCTWINVPQLQKRDDSWTRYRPSASLTGSSVTQVPTLTVPTLMRAAVHKSPRRRRRSPAVTESR